jgi:hypothetical protein
MAPQIAEFIKDNSQLFVKWIKIIWQSVAMVV